MFYEGSLSRWKSLERLCFIFLSYENIIFWGKWWSTLWLRAGRAVRQQAGAAQRHGAEAERLDQRQFQGSPGLYPDTAGRQDESGASAEEDRRVHHSHAEEDHWSPGRNQKFEESKLSVGVSNPSSREGKTNWKLRQCPGDPWDRQSGGGRGYRFVIQIFMKNISFNEF